MNKPLIMITGASSGIGYALAEIVAQRGYPVLAIARRQKLLTKLAEKHPLISIVAADISEQAGREQVMQVLAEKGQMIYLVNNAAISMPKIFSQLTATEWQQILAINVEAPMWLVQACQPYFSHSRVLNISSGLAHYALAGASAYCLTKAALYMLYQVINAEYDPKIVIAGSLRPGIIDTPMQAVLRNSDPELFPSQAKFQNFYDQNALRDPHIVAEFIAEVLLNSSDEAFKQKEWDIDE